MLKRIFSPPNEQGQGLAEYAMILILVSVVSILILIVFGTSVRDFYCDVARRFDPYIGIGVPGACEDSEEEDSGAAPVAIVWIAESAPIE